MKGFIMKVPYLEAKTSDELLSYCDVFLSNHNWESAADCAEEFLGRKREDEDAEEWRKKRYAVACKLQQAALKIVWAKTQALSAMHAAVGRAIVEVGLATDRTTMANSIVAALDPTNLAKIFVSPPLPSSEEHY